MYQRPPIRQDRNGAEALLSRLPHNSGAGGGLGLIARMRPVRKLDLGLTEVGQGAAGDGTQADRAERLCGPAQTVAHRADLGWARPLLAVEM
jgi:hypothetical protein